MAALERNMMINHWDFFGSSDAVHPRNPQRATTGATNTPATTVRSTQASTVPAPVYAPVRLGWDVLSLVVGQGLAGIRCLVRYLLVDILFQLPWVGIVPPLEVCDRQPVWYTGQISATGHTCT